MGKRLCDSYILKTGACFVTLSLHTWRKRNWVLNRVSLVEQKSVVGDSLLACCCCCSEFLSLCYLVYAFGTLRSFLTMPFHLICKPSALTVFMSVVKSGVLVKLTFKILAYISSYVLWRWVIHSKPVVTDGICAEWEVKRRCWAQGNAFLSEITLTFISSS